MPSIPFCVFIITVVTTLETKYFTEKILNTAVKVNEFV